MKRNDEGAGILVRLVTWEMLNVIVFVRKCYIPAFPEIWLLEVK